MDKELLKGSLDLLLLSIIARRDTYGYEIAKELQERSQDTYQISQGTLYPALRRLESKGWIRSYWGESEAEGRRKFYAITDLGREKLKEKLSDWDRLSSLIQSVRKVEWT
ncbi:PadR family transcriptional regulator [Polycladomyces subterraneus]|uniref:PadR family transcriptional regulator n=1 Tax=Polycladomyces subterraneus TaxID=1016997 RepID=A0ABT8INY5_9BACL|nr:PadR family transcriptional regulator [Polycladomyces subterraneus]MDN4593834.1 PadR family transcriptional regulator [Polycladomyces subterraneus]